MASQPTVSSIYSLLVRDILDDIGLPTSVRSVPGPFDGSWPTADAGAAAEVASIALLNNLFKKCQDEPHSDAAEVCVLAFLESNAKCDEWRVPSESQTPLKSLLGNLVFNPDYKGYEEEDRRFRYDVLKECFRSIFLRPTPDSLLKVPGFDGSDPWSWSNIFLLGNVGPGASVGASGGSWLEKFYLSPLTYCNEEILTQYRQSLQIGTLTAVAETMRQLEYGSQQVLGGSFGSVPKSYKTERSIETQPTLEMWVQKGIAEIMLAFIESAFGVNLSTQPTINRELAKRGSNPKGRSCDMVATIDLKEASNRIPWALIRDLLSDTQLGERIASARVKYTKMPWGEWLPLNMCSTMGNGFTFALQTALFLAVVESTLTLSGHKMRRQTCISHLTASPLHQVENWLQLVDAGVEEECDFVQKSLALKPGVQMDRIFLEPWGVFGDDIIVPVNQVDNLLKQLELIGATVNTDKSFHSGDFRESCGGDFFRGVNVRAVYARSLKSPQDRVSLLNRLVEWSARHKIVLRRVCTSLWSSLPEKLRVPLAEMDTAGLKVTDKFSLPYPSTRALESAIKDAQTSVVPYRSWVPKPQFLNWEGRQLTIYGPGLLLSMIRGETVSSLKGRWNRSDLARIEYVLKTGLRAQDLLYDTRLSYSYGWNRTTSTLPHIWDLEWSLEVNLFSKD
jgi:hypothetical protein